MSVKIMGLVWDCDLPKEQKYVLLAYADHADHDGRNIYPSYGRVAWKTGYSRRSIIRFTQELALKKILIPDGDGPNNVHRWRINVHRLPQRADYRPGDDDLSSAEKISDTAPAILDDGGDSLTPPDPARGDSLSLLETEGVTASHPGGDTGAQGVTASHLRGDSLTPKPSLTVNLKPSIESSGGGCAKTGPPKTLEDAWSSFVLTRSIPGGSLPKKVMDLYVKTTRPESYNPESGEVIMLASSAQNRDWLTDRMTKELQHHMIGYFNRDIDVHFVAP